jgi:hypothetical protein
MNSTLRELVKTLPDWESLPLGGIVSVLNSPTIIENPYPQEKVRRGFRDLMGFREMVEPEDFEKLLTQAPRVAESLSALSKIFQLDIGKISDEDKVFLLGILGLSEVSIKAILLRASELIPDPEWEPHIKLPSIAVRELGQPVTHEDVFLALNF